MYWGRAAYAHTCPTSTPSSGGGTNVTVAIQFGGQTINNTTQSAAVGQQIALTAKYSLPAGVSATSQSWSVGGTTVGGYNASSTSGATIPTNFSGQNTTFYWIAGGSPINVTFTVKLSGGSQSSATASATFNVAAPTGVGVSIPTMGNVVISSAPAMQLGGTKSNVGIGFGASATPPPGTSNNFTWVQLINSDAIQLTPSNGNPVLNCVPQTLPIASTYPALDTEYPYSTSSSTNDNPAIGLQTTYKEESRTFSATMYLMWSPGLSGSIPVPLGYVAWQFAGDAKFASNQWTLSSSSRSNNGFTASSSYTSWDSQDPNNGSLTCH
jgi:hypothetical protein